MRLKDLLRFCDSYKKIYCYGAGRFGREILIYLQEQGRDIEGFLVSPGQQENEIVLGKKVVSLENQVDDECGIILAVGPKYQPEMEEELHLRGLRNYLKTDDAFLKNLEKNTKFSTRYPSNQYINVLMYHRVGNTSNNPWDIIVSPQHFEEHMRSLKEKYPVIRFEDDWSSIKDPSVVITFDDGYQDNCTNALPILEKYGLPATIFVSTENLDSDRFFWWSRLENIFNNIPETIDFLGNRLSNKDIKIAHSILYPLLPKEKDIALTKIESELNVFYADGRESMSLEELQHISSSPLITIGAHTVTHSSLIHETYELQEWEIRKSKEVLEKMLQCDIEMFSYPFGDYDEDIIAILKKFGFKKSATVENGLAGTGDAFRIPRNMVRDQDGREFDKFLERMWCTFSQLLV